MRGVAVVVMVVVAAVGCGDSGTSSDAPPGGDDDGAPPAADASTDPFEAARAACIDKINALRATKGRAAYTRWRAMESCVDDEATADETSGTPHGAFAGGMTCGANGQNECLGAGVDGIVGCLDSMWGEKDQAGCSGCDACADGYDPNCPNCDFYGDTTGDVCGHYVNMSANYFSMAACGFSSLGGWDAINFR